MNRVTILLAALAMAGALGGCGQAPANSAASTAPTAPAGTVDGSRADSDTPTTPVPTPAEPATRTINVAVRGGQVSGDTGRVEVPLGTPVTLFVTSDVADEIHLHGYDREAPVPAGGVGSISFIATIPGVFEVELHEADLQLLQLQVS